MLVQPEEDATAALVEHIQGHPSLIVSCGDSQIAVQVVAHPDGANMAAGFARDLAVAAQEFADRCATLQRRSALPPASALIEDDFADDAETGRHALLSDQSEDAAEGTGDEARSPRGGDAG